VAACQVKCYLERRCHLHRRAHPHAHDTLPDFIQDLSFLTPQAFDSLLQALKHPKACDFMQGMLDISRLCFDAKTLIPFCQDPLEHKRIQGAEDYVDQYVPYHTHNLQTSPHPLRVKIAGEIYFRHTVDSIPSKAEQFQYMLDQPHRLVLEMGWGFSEINTLMMALHTQPEHRWNPDQVEWLYGELLTSLNPTWVAQALSHPQQAALHARHTSGLSPALLACFGFALNWHRTATPPLTDQLVARCMRVPEVFPYPALRNTDELSNFSLLWNPAHSTCSITTDPTHGFRHYHVQVDPQGLKASLTQVLEILDQQGHPLLLEEAQLIIQTIQQWGGEFNEEDFEEPDDITPELLDYYRQHLNPLKSVFQEVFLDRTLFIDPSPTKTPQPSKTRL